MLRFKFQPRSEWWVITCWPILLGRPDGGTDLALISELAFCELGVNSFNGSSNQISSLLLQRIVCMYISYFSTHVNSVGRSRTFQNWWRSTANSADSDVKPLEELSAALQGD